MDMQSVLKRIKSSNHCMTVEGYEQSQSYTKEGVLWKCKCSLGGHVYFSDTELAEEILSVFEGDTIIAIY